MVVHLPPCTTTWEETNQGHAAGDGVLISIQPPQPVHQGHLAATDHCHQAEKADPDIVLKLPISMGHQKSFAWGYKQGQNWSWHLDYGPILHQSSTCPSLLEISSSLLLLLCWKSVYA